MRMAQASRQQDEIAEFKGAFELFDKNRDGTVDVRELRNVLRSLGQDPTSEELMEMVEEVDFNQNGVIDFNEFLTMMISRLDNIDYEGEMIAAFRTFDLNGDGHISAVELRHIMSKLGSDITDEEIEEMMLEAQISGNGQIDYAMFAQMMVTK
uniref:Calmodulin n=1 Tax=Pinguiococcus pyrenoidosus TaxID=172671 RepID=A0A7R9UHT9_9STRA|mmetsp:Transcript_9704/g.36412  ORF Transcript_9704/g.36412 Transcript_9704/m.36412 type:complete len:153 (+) Transcript_9704:366-824(+)